MVRHNAPRSRSVIEQTSRILTDLGPLPVSRELPTMWVRRKVDGKHILVNESDYGYDEKLKKDRPYPTRHFEAAPGYDPEFDEARAPSDFVAETTIQVSSYTEADLMKLKSNEIKRLPEWPHVKPGVRYKDVAGMVAAIMEVRERGKPSKKRKGKVVRETLDTSSPAQGVGS